MRVQQYCQWAARLLFYSHPAESAAADPASALHPQSASGRCRREPLLKQPCCLLPQGSYVGVFQAKDHGGSLLFCVDLDFNIALGSSS